MQILPGEGTCATLVTATDAHRLLDITEEEREKHQFTIHENGRIEWKNDCEAEIDLKHDHISLIKKEIDRIDKDEKVTIFQLETFIKMKDL